MREHAKIFVFEKGQQKATYIIEMNKDQYEKVLKLPGVDINQKLRYLLKGKDLLHPGHPKDL